jgi:hypothetical protein
MGFLAQLTAQALGVRPDGAAVASLPPRFAPPVHAALPEAEPAAAVQERPLTSTSPPSPPSAVPATDPAATVARRAPHAASTWPAEAPGRTPPSVVSPAASGTDRPAAQPAESAGPPGPVAPAPPLAVPPASPAGDRPAATATIRLVAPATETHPVAPRDGPAPAAARAREPLREAAVAGRVRAAERTAPVINVTIDRIEVRAPAPPKPASESRRPPPAPSVSLTDYLRGADNGAAR